MTTNRTYTIGDRVLVTSGRMVKVKATVTQVFHNGDVRVQPDDRPWFECFPHEVEPDA